MYQSTIRVESVDVDVETTLDGKTILVVEAGIVGGFRQYVPVAKDCPECVLRSAARGLAQRYLAWHHREQVAADCRRIYERSQAIAMAQAPSGWANGFAALAM